MYFQDWERKLTPYQRKKDVSPSNLGGNQLSTTCTGQLQAHQTATVIWWLLSGQALQITFRISMIINLRISPHVSILHLTAMRETSNGLIQVSYEPLVSRFFFFPVCWFCCVHLTIFIPGSPPAVKLENTILSKLFVKDVSQLSPQHQTYSLEAFHSLMLKFSPKHTGFSYLGMYSR